MMSMPSRRGNVPARSATETRLEHVQSRAHGYTRRRTAPPLLLAAAAAIAVLGSFAEQQPMAVVDAWGLQRLPTRSVGVRPASGSRCIFQGDAKQGSLGGSHTRTVSFPIETSWKPRRRLVARPDLSSLSASPSNNNQDEPAQGSAADNERVQGSVLGASLLFAGTAIGAGMLALPAETAPAGYGPSQVSLLACWAFTFVTSLVTLEASWSVGAGSGVGDRSGSRSDSDSSKSAKGGKNEENAEAGAGFLSISQQTLGPVGAGVTVVLFWFLLTSIIVAYTSEGGELIAQAAAEITQSALQIPTTLGSTLFMAFFASLAIFGTERVDIVNRILVAGLIGTFLGLVGIGLPQIDAGLLARADWTEVYPPVISVGILSFGAQNVVPTLLQYLGRDADRTRRAILIGSLIPLVMYSLWELVFLGMVPYDADGGGSKMQIVAALGETGGAIVQDMVEIFSACSIGSSMAGASVSLVDFFQDGLTSFTTLRRDEQATEPTPESSPLGGRLVAAALALGPPLGLACAFPGAFLSALENAGLIGGVSLYGLLPALAVLKLRAGNEESSLVGGEADDESAAKIMPGRLMGGTTALYGILGVSTVLLVPEIVRLGGMALGSS